MEKRFLIGGGHGQSVFQLGAMGNRHGLISGATGTGKTVSLQVIAENFSRIGVPVFAADIKGDLSGIAQAGNKNSKIENRLRQIGIKDFQPEPSPVVFWDIFGRNGHPIRATISEMGPLLLSSLLELNDTQTGILYACFRIADDQGLLLLDLKDLRAMLKYVVKNARTLKTAYGNISAASIGAIQRRLLILEEQGGNSFFGEPALDIADLMRTDFSGRGVISLLDATTLLAQSPQIYAVFLLWLLSELFEQLPEIGNAELPKLVFFFDEAHLLFHKAPKVLVEKIEQVVRLIRSKGVGIYFVTQHPTDIPESVLSQLGLKVQHALRAFTPKEADNLRVVARTFRVNPKIKTEELLTRLGTGEALVSVLDEKGTPTMVEHVLICPPRSHIGVLAETEQQVICQRSPMQGRYETPLDRESAYEVLQNRARQAAQAEQAATKTESSGLFDWLDGSGKRQGIGEAMAKSVARSIGSQLGRQIVRGILGSLFGKK